MFNDWSICHGDTLPAVLESVTLPGMLYRATSYSTGITFYRRDNSTSFQSYQDLLRSAQCILRGLRLQGLQKSDRFILQLEDPSYFFACLWAAWLGGFVPIPLGIDLGSNNPNGKLHQAWELCGQPLIVSDSPIEFSGKVLRVTDLLDYPPDDDYYYGKADDLALLLFTSGSTGKPKGVMLSARNLIASVYGMATVNDLSSSDISLNWMPLEHIASLVMFHLTEVYLGCGQIQVDKELILQNPLLWLDLIHRDRVTATWSPNFAYSLVCDGLEKGVTADWDLSCLRWMGNGAEAVVGKTTARFLELLAPYGLSDEVVSPGYGMSETASGICHSHDFYSNRNQDFVSVGSPIPGVSLRIVNENNKIIPEGEIGLLQVKGETVTAGYFKQPELNKEIFTADGWFNTGDLGFLNKGQLTITGRQKDVIIINGVNYYSQDIETVVEAIAGVKVSYTAACGVLDFHQQEQVAVFLSTDKQGDRLRELINTVRKDVFNEVGVSPTYILPVTPDTIPKTEIGKIKRSQLATRFNAGEFKDIVAKVEGLLNKRNLTQQELPQNAIEQDLVRVWREVLDLNTVGVKDNFFELGGNSLLLMQVLSKLTPKHNLSAVTLFQYPTISTLANYLNADEESVAIQQGKRRGELRRNKNQDVAIIGMSCRFPGANNINQFWSNLCQGVESISWFSDREIINSGVAEELVSHPDYVKASPILDDVTGFDADFWGYSPKEAQLLDPQQRLFLECVWESLEDAGYDPFNYAGDISLYGGAATNTYLLNNIYPNRDRLDEQDSLQVINLSSMGGFAVSTANDKDYLTTRVSYKLNLTGSSVNVQTACSTSLVAVHLACQSLINSECDLALAGGVSVHSPQKLGYLSQSGMILSADGHCRAFDAEATGTIFGSGAGMVVLKLLDKAIEDGDRIYGVVKGSAVNNDGGTKVGYFAPNVDGQTRVISEALAVANISPDSVGYVEAHGTGTKLGDPIEVTALSQAYHDDIRKTPFCGLGSVKTNLGHLQMASGIVGLIKATLCIYHRQIPPSLHFNNPNPQIDFDRSPFYINTQLQDWNTSQLRRAGVNSLGIGGTNAHLILEEYSNVSQAIDKLLPGYLLTLSAKTPTALKELAVSYQKYLKENNDIPLQDICLTSNIGRHHFDYRCAIVSEDKQELIDKLQDISIGTVEHNRIAFLFTGQGSQYIDMARQLYNTCDLFREHCDRCFDILQSYCDLSIDYFTQSRQDAEDVIGDEAIISNTEYLQPLLFVIEYALAQLWLAWGIQPDVLIGHSIGEYVAATIAEVFSLEDALKLVSSRGKLIQSLPENGAMLAVFISRDRFNSLIPKDIFLAADNGSHVVVSGLEEDINIFAKKLDSLAIKTQLLDVSYGFHSLLMQPIVEDFRKLASTINYSLPKTPLISNLTGELATEEIATADYWVNHLLQPVQFAKSIDYLDRQQVNIFLEIGTKPTLTTIVKSLLDNKILLHSLDRSPDKNHPDWQNILTAVSQLYKAGIDLNWLAISQDYQAQKTSLPTYAFQRQRYWFEIPPVDTKYKTPAKDLIHPLLGQVISSPIKQNIFQSYLSPNTISWLEDHCLINKIVFPGTGYLEIAIALGVSHFQTHQLAIENVAITSPLYIQQPIEIQTILFPQTESATWEVYSLTEDKWQLHCSGEISKLEIVSENILLKPIKTRFNSATEIDIQQHYQSCNQKGNNYGKNFQGIKQLWIKDNQALGLIELPNIASHKYHFHPALLDSCLQILLSALPKELQNNTYIPVGLDRFELYSLPQNRVWSYLELKPVSNQQLSADVWLYNQVGNLIAKIEGLRSQPIKTQSVWHNWLYQPQWKLGEWEMGRLGDGEMGRWGDGEMGRWGDGEMGRLGDEETWLMFSDSQGVGKQVATQLISQQQQYHLVTRGDINNNPQAFVDLIQQYSQTTKIIYLWSLDSDDNQLECQTYLYLVQALIELNYSHHLYLVTRNAQPVDNYQLTPGINNSCLWGMQKAIALEYPELLSVTIDLDLNPTDKDGDNIYREIGTKETEVAYRNDKRYVNRLVRYSWDEKQTVIESNQQLQINHPGNLDSLEWKSIPRQQPQANEIEIEVKATGLNFRDLMVALDLYPDTTKFLGLECAGVVTRIGKQVTNFNIGDEVMAIASNSFSQYLTVDSSLAITKPPSLSFNSAATIPVTFLTSYYTLVYLAQLQPGETILIHSAAGGVGLAAIQIAQQIGAQIYATASTPKWELLKSKGVKQIYNSRSLDFAEEIISATNGKGVDVVLNSLSGEFITKSMAVLKPSGRFVEIGKQDIWTPKFATQNAPKVKYFIVDLWRITTQKPQLIQQMLTELRSQFIAHQLQPLPHTTFTSHKTIDAFRYMQQGKHQGKIIITPSSPVRFQGTYLITGGMGAIGLEVAQLLSDKGVKNLVLLGRSDIQPQYQDRLQKLSQHTQVNLIKADISNKNQLAQTLKQIESTLPPLRGVVHCAGIKSDRTIPQQDWDSFQQVLAPKVSGAWNLHLMTQKYDLESFILFSSASSLIGSAGQVNYCAGNAFLDTLAHARRSLGLPAMSINWSGWEDTGLAASTQINQSWQQKGIGAIEPHQGIEILDRLQLDPPIQIGVMPIDWETWQNNHSVTAFYQDLIKPKPATTNNHSDLQQLLNAIPQQRRSLIAQQLTQQVGNILGIEDISTIDLELGFSELGLDSLGSVELRNKIQNSYSIKLSPTVIFDYPNFKSLTNHLLYLLFDSRTANQDSKINENIANIEQLSEAEAEALLLEELDKL